MRRQLLATALLILASSQTFSDTIFRCIDPATQTVTFSDQPCANIASTQHNVKQPNRIPGITQYEQRLLNRFDERIRGQHSGKAKSGENKRTKTNQAKYCIANQMRINKISLKLKRGYNSKQYNYYHDKLRSYKKYRNRYCA